MLHSIYRKVKEWIHEETKSYNCDEDVHVYEMNGMDGGSWRLLATNFKRQFDQKIFRV